MAKSRFIFAFLSLLLVSLELASTARIKGTLTVKGMNKNKVHYLTKYGVARGSTVYLYGNAYITSNSSGILTFIPYEIWNDINQKHNRYDCSLILGSLNNTNSCRYDVPCSTDVCRSPGSLSLCPIFEGKFLDYRYMLQTTENDKTQFWYLVFLSCSHTEDGDKFNYDLHIVNANPAGKDHDPFTYQFPYNEHGFLITYMTFALLYAILVPVHFMLHIKYTIKCQTPRLIWLFNFALLFEAFNILCGLIHYAVYSQNGTGVQVFYYIKGLLNLVGDWFLILVLILIAGGWMVTIRMIKWKIASFLFIGIYIFLSIVYYICSVVYPEVQPWEIHHPLQNWAGGLYLAGRGLLLFYVWYQLYHIHRQEEKLQKLRLYRVLFVIFTVWFWYLPLVVIIVSLINPVVAWVMLINFMNIMNFLVNIIMTALFCPIWSHEYFQFDHILNSRSSSVLLSSFGFSKQYTKIGDADPHVL